MKRLFIIAMCLLTLGVSSCKKDNKDDNKFEGTYKGTVKGTPTSIIGGQTLPEVSYDVELQLNKGEVNNELNARFILGDKTHNVKGATLFDNIVFESFKTNLEMYGQTMETDFLPTAILSGNNLELTCQIVAQDSTSLIQANLIGNLAKQ